MTDRLRILKLDEDKFFRIPPCGGGIILPSLAGEAGPACESSMLPCDPPCVNAGVAGDSLACDSLECTEFNGVIGCVASVLADGGPIDGPADTA